ncbi:MAG: hypothetical protein WA944_00300 [Mycobacterium sp.]
MFTVSADQGVGLGGSPVTAAGCSGPVRDFTDHQLRGEAIPNPPDPDVTADQLRIALMQQRIDYNDFARWFNETYGGTTSPQDMLKRIAAFKSGVGLENLLPGVRGCSSPGLAHPRATNRAGLRY